VVGFAVSECDSVFLISDMRGSPYSPYLAVPICREPDSTTGLYSLVISQTISKVEIEGVAGSNLVDITCLIDFVVAFELFTINSCMRE
jgi:hypothetical protein